MSFALLIAQFDGHMPKVASDLREKLFKLLITDEIFIVGSTLFNRIDTKL